MTSGLPNFGLPIKTTKVMRNLVAGNWKSNKLMGEALEWMDGMAAWLQAHSGVEVMVAPPAPFLAVCAEKAPAGLHVLAQNVSAEGMGAYTGEYTAEMLKSCGVAGALVGHSERRARYGDSDAAVAAKVDALLDAGLVAVFCCGETLQEREGGRAEDVVLQQLQSGVLRLPVDRMTHVVVAYEPVWAIGTGVTATSDQAQAMHASIRRWLEEAFGEEVAAEIPLLYGGSCKASNAAELFAQRDINGGLIGGASLVPADFQGVLEGHPALNR
jgi:triosephosphate isomerase (TIM)